MIPNFRIETNNVDITESIRSRLLRLNIRDEVGYKSDSLSLTLAGAGVQWPKKGQELRVALGYDNVLTTVGYFICKEPSYSDEPAPVLTIHASAMDQSASLKDQREQSWEATTLGAIAEEIARRNQLKPFVFDELKQIAIEHEDQTESDLAFLLRLGRRYDLAVKVSGRYLMVTPKDRSRASPSGSKSLIHIERPTILEYSGGDNDKYTGVRAFWWDSAAAEKKYVMYGKEGVILELEFNKVTEAEARRAAESKYRQIARKGKSLKLKVPGSAQFAAECFVDVGGVPPEIDREWVVEAVEQDYTESAWWTILDCCPDGEQYAKKKVDATTPDPSDDDDEPKSDS